MPHEKREGGSHMTITLDTPVTDFPGVGPARAKKLEKLGILRAADLLTYYPRDYEDRRRIWSIWAAPLGEKVCVSALAAERPVLSYIRKGMELVKLRVVDNSGTLYLTFFNQSYLKNSFQPGEEYVFYGEIQEQGSRRSMVNPVFEREGDRDFTGRIVPVYPLTAGISNHLMVSLIRQAVEQCAGQGAESLPASLRAAHQLVPAERACRDIHFPEDFDALEQARRRLTFEELFYLSAGLALLKDRRDSQCSAAVFAPCPLEAFCTLLPFAPTQAQRRAMEETARDLASGRPMNRLVQGDVGSGKTTVAAWGAWLAAQSGWQSALMAPTEVLAEQHYRTMNQLLSPAGVRVALFTGSMTAAEKRAARAALRSGEVDLAVGTQALLSQGVDFARLGLVITDEQHRFGVAQRAALAAKGAAPQSSSPHVLVMSATPIPRTLALIIYGDLDVSVIDQLPPGRVPVQTFVVGESKRQRMYNFVRKQAGEGRQTYIVCPAVEESTGDGAPPGLMDLKAVKVYARQLQEQVFPQLRVGLLYGKMKPREKEAVMSAFARGELQVLVSTTVIEVGVDVPNAALMIVENAERFGLSQLHQLRGRVGRGRHQSYCVLLTSNRSPDTLARLRVFASTTDGFKISEEDLKLRCPGDFFGRRQHGLPTLRLADLSGDMRLLSEAQQAARDLLSADPRLALGENRPVLERVRALFSDTPDIFN